MYISNYFVDGCSVKYMDYGKNLVCTCIWKGQPYPVNYASVLYSGCWRQSHGSRSSVAYLEQIFRCNNQW